MNPPRHRSAFTLFELIIVLFIIASLIGLLMIALNRDRHIPDNGVTFSRLRQLGIGAHWFLDTYKRMPPAFDSVLEKGPFSIHVHLLPFLEERPAFEAFVAGRGNPDAVIEVFTSPRDPSGEAPGVQNFAANLRVFSKKGFDTPYNVPLPALAECEPGEAIMPGSF